MRPGALMQAHLLSLRTSKQDFIPIQGPLFCKSCSRNCTVQASADEQAMHDLTSALARNDRHSSLCTNMSLHCTWQDASTSFERNPSLACCALQTVEQQTPACREKAIMVGRDSYLERSTAYLAIAKFRLTSFFRNCPNFAAGRRSAAAG